MSFVLSIIALFWIAALAKRVKYLEERMQPSKGEVTASRNESDIALSRPAIASITEEAAVSPLAASSATEEATSQRAQSESSSFQSGSPSIVEKFFHWFSIDWPMKLGAILLFLAFGWIVTVVFWDAIGPVGQVSLGFLVGIAMIFFGAKRIEQYANQGSVLLSLGAGIIFITTFAARTQYDLFSPAVALLFMFLVTVFVAYVSVIQKNLPLALLGLFLGGIAPILTHSPEPSVFGLFSYLFVLIAGTLWVVRLTGWRALTVAALGLYGLYVLPFILTAHAADPDQGTKVLVAIFFAFLFFIASILSTLHHRKDETSDLIVNLVNGMILLGWINAIIPPEWQSFMAVLVALVATIGAYIVYSLTGLREPVYSHSAIAGVFIAMATAYELSGSILIIAYILEVTALVLGARFLLQDDSAARKATLVSILPIGLSLMSLANYALATEVFTKDFFALLLLTLMCFLFTLIFHTDEEKHSDVLGCAGLFAVLGVLYALALVWLSLHIALAADQATMLALLVYTIVGMVLYIKGKVAAEKKTKTFGAALLLLVTGHLLLIDVWEMDVVGRIATFSIIGALFMSTAFIGKKKQQ